MLVLVAASFEGMQVSASPSISLNPSSGPTGTNVIVAGSGFDPADSNCQITFDGNNVGACLISGSGEVTGGFYVPDQGDDYYSVLVTGSYLNGMSTQTASELFVITGSSQVSTTVNGPFVNAILPGQTSSNGYSISFNPDHWFCNQWESVLFQGPIVENGVAGHSLNFRFIQQSSPAGGYQSNIFLEKDKIFFADSVSFNIDPAWWNNVSFSSMPDIVVQVIDASTISATNPAPAPLLTYDAGNIIASPCPTSVTTSSAVSSTVQIVTVTSTATPEFPTGILTMLAALVVALLVVHQKGISMRSYNSKLSENWKN